MQNGFLNLVEISTLVGFWLHFKLIGLVKVDTR